MKWGLKVSYRGPTNNFRNKSQNNVDRIKDGQDVFDEVSFDKVCIVLWCMNFLTFAWHQNPDWRPGRWYTKNSTTAWHYLDIKTLVGSQVFGAWKMIQQSDSISTSNPCFQTDLWCIDWLVGCFGFSGLLRQCFSLYRAFSQWEGERGEKGQRRVKMSKQDRGEKKCPNNPLPHLLQAQ